MTTTFPTHPVRLRRDLAIELGFLDTIRNPTPGLFEIFMNQAHVPQEFRNLAAYRQKTASLSPPGGMAYWFFTVPSSGESHVLATNGVFRFILGRSSKPLFEHTLGLFERTLPPALVNGGEQSLFRKALRETHAIFHDVDTGEARLRRRVDLDFFFREYRLAALEWYPPRRK